MEKVLNAEQVRVLLQYDMNSGTFTWRAPASATAPAGSVAGRITRHGYRTIGIGGRKYMAHRLAWLYVNGVWPTGEIDHRNGIRFDNSLNNLRDCSRRVNAQNLHGARSDSSGGVLGVSRRGNRYRATITDHGRHIHIGYFASEEDAYQAYLKAKTELHEGSELTWRKS